MWRFQPLKQWLLKQWLSWLQQSRKSSQRKRRLALAALSLSTLLCATQLPAQATRTPLPAAAIVQQSQTPADAFQQGQHLYEQGQYEQAIAPLKQAIQAYQQSGETLAEAIALSNLSLTHQQLNQWPEATQAIEQSLIRLQQAKVDPTTQAQILDIHGSLQLSLGQAEAALKTWQQTETLYQATQNTPALLQSRINQAQALRVLGFYRRARNLLQDIQPRLSAEASGQPSVNQAIQLRLLGDALRLSGDLEQAQQLQLQSLEISNQLNDARLTSAATFSLANTARAAFKTQEALQYYQTAAQTTPDLVVRLNAQISQLSLLMADQRWDAAQSLLGELIPQGSQLPESQTGLYGRIHLAQAVLDANVGGQGDRPTFLDAYAAPLEALLRQTVTLASQIGDRRSQSYALGTLGHFYEQTRQERDAIDLTQQALRNAQTLDAPDISYRWNWQLGRLLARTEQPAAAVSAYDDAIDDLNRLRSDLVAVNRDIQFSFKESVEPVYRQSVGLLVQESDGANAAQNLEKARARIEALQVAELDNFFREACLDGKAVLLDKVVDQDNPTTAIVYPIILEDRLEVIVKIPEQPLAHHTIFESRPTVESLLRALREDLPLASKTFQVKQRSKLIYEWLLAPIEKNLQASEVDTLVFVLDGAFRNVPMGVLYDGEQYVVEKYAIGVSLGLQLLEPKAIAQERLNVLAAGLINPPADFAQFPPLPNIATEFQRIVDAGVTNQQLLNQEFTSQSLETKIQGEGFNIVHLATHGQFSSKAEETFVLAADGPIRVTELDNLLRDRSQSTRQAIELLILSACQTAAGDDRAALGLAGVAVKAGARSTLASLWQVDDWSTALLMGEFYQQIAKVNGTETSTKAQALRQAQLSLLNDPELRDPAYWAPYVLVGNWL